MLLETFCSSCGEALSLKVVSRSALNVDSEGAASRNAISERVPGVSGTGRGALMCHYLPVHICPPSVLLSMAPSP